MVAMRTQTKWPSKLVKVYLEDSLTDRIWVDLDECKAFVLNLETALPPCIGDPRGLFTVLCGNQLVPAIQTALGLAPQPIPIDITPNAKLAASELTDAIAVALQSGPTTQTARIIHCGDPARLVSARFENCSSSVETVILKTLREALSRRSIGLSLASSDSSSSAGGPPPPSGEMIHTRCLIRTLAITAGVSEVRSLAASRLEPWLTVGFLLWFNFGYLFYRFIPFF